jgi:hypothetical protein
MAQGSKEVREEPTLRAITYLPFTVTRSSNRTVLLGVASQAHAALQECVMDASCPGKVVRDGRLPRAVVA